MKQYQNALLAALAFGVAPSAMADTSAPVKIAYKFKVGDDFTYKVQTTTSATLGIDILNASVPIETSTTIVDHVKVVDVRPDGVAELKVTAVSGSQTAAGQSTDLPQAMLDAESASLLVRPNGTIAQSRTPDGITMKIPWLGFLGSGVLGLTGYLPPTPAKVGTIWHNVIKNNISNVEMRSAVTGIDTSGPTPLTQIRHVSKGKLAESHAYAGDKMLVFAGIAELDEMKFDNALGKLISCDTKIREKAVVGGNMKFQGNGMKKTVTVSADIGIQVTLVDGSDAADPTPQ